MCSTMFEPSVRKKKPVQKKRTRNPRDQKFIKHVLDFFLPFGSDQKGRKLFLTLWRLALYPTVQQTEQYQHP